MRRSLLCIAALLTVTHGASNDSHTDCTSKGFIASKSGKLIFTPNAWNATSPGSQCISVNADYTSFNATFNWPIGPFNVHSFPHVSFKSDYLPLPITDITNLTLSGRWSMSPAAPEADDLESTGVIANVAWDLFADANTTAAQIEVDAKYEIMFWIGSFGPSRPQPLGWGQTCLEMTVHDIPFVLYCGVHPKRDQKVFTWLSDSNVTDFNFDFNPLVQALPSNNLVPADINIGLVEFGTEAFYTPENVTFSTSNFGMDLQSKNPPAHKSGVSRAVKRVPAMWFCV